MASATTAASMAAIRSALDTDKGVLARPQYRMDVSAVAALGAMRASTRAAAVH
jgi:hypothetical protein